MRLAIYIKLSYLMETFFPLFLSLINPSSCWVRNAAIKAGVRSSTKKHTNLKHVLLGLTLPWDQEMSVYNRKHSTTASRKARNWLWIDNEQALPHVPFVISGCFSVPMRLYNKCLRRPSWVGSIIIMLWTYLFSFAYKALSPWLSHVILSATLRGK